jgi:hypothetical protein
MSEIYQGFTGWVDDPAEVQRTVNLITMRQGMPAYFVLGGMSTQVAEDETVLFWEAEKKVLGKILPSWNQGSVGSCVSFGYGRASQDLMLIEIAKGEPEEWPGCEVATEPIYGGSRVEVGGGRISGDGSVGAWAAEWVRRWGILLRKVYGNYDLGKYSESRCRAWGQSGCPDDLEPIAKQHPVRTVGIVSNGDECWTAIGNGYPVPVCSGQGFTSRLVDGFCEASGSWAHCMTIRGRFVHPQRGKSFVIQNSWGGYLSGEPKTKDIHGKEIELPEGCFSTTANVVDRMMRARDSFALSGLDGFPARRLDWII